MGVVIIAVILVVLSSIPSMVICAFFNILFEDKIPSKILVPVAIFLAIATGFLLNIELEGGLLSLPFQLVVLSSAWVLMLAIGFKCYVYYMQQNKHST